MTRFQLDDDDLDEDDDDFDDENDDTGDDEGEDDEQEDEDDDTETWQVAGRGAFPLKGGSNLTSGAELPRLAPIFQLS